MFQEYLMQKMSLDYSSFLVYSYTESIFKKIFTQNKKICTQITESICSYFEMIITQ